MAVEVVPVEQSAVKNGAWYTLASCMSMLLVSGTIYGFGEWSVILKEPSGYNYSQDAVEALAMAANLGNYIVLDSGLLVAKCGPVAALAMGCTYACLGYLALWACTAVFPGQAPFGVLLCFCILYGHGCGTIDTAAMSEVLADFPDHKGVAAGCMKTFFGMATATMAAVYQAAFAPTRTGFLLLLGISSAASGFVLVPIIAVTRGLVAEPQKRVQNKFRILVAGLAVAIAFFFAVHVLASKISRPLWTAILVVITLGVLSLFLLGTGKRSSAVDSGEGASVRSGTTGYSHRSPVDIGAWDMLGHFDFYAFLIVLVAAQGAGLLFINNSAQIILAMGGSDDTVTSFVSVISVFNASGRLLYGYVSESLRARVYRPWFLVISLCILGSSYIVLYFVGPSIIWVAAGAVGFAYGGVWAVQPVMVSEIFGQRDFGFKYSCATLGAGTGSILFGTVLAGRLYAREAKARGEDPACTAPSCFNTAFLVTAVITVPILLLAVVLCRRTAWIYKQLSTRYEPEGSPKDDGSSSSSDGAPAATTESADTDSDASSTCEELG